MILSDSLSHKIVYTYFVSKWVNREYRQLFTKNQFHQAMKHAKVNNLSTVTYEQVLSIFNDWRKSSELPFLYESLL
ncbi:hypothetical protein EfmJHP36_02770 [Enterococcus faecium]|nr:hypothetical protein EfmJHP36_02770 [Enterococcus faecium]